MVNTVCRSSPLLASPSQTDGGYPQLARCARQPSIENRRAVRGRRSTTFPRQRPSALDKNPTMPSSSPDGNHCPVTQPWSMPNHIPYPQQEELVLSDGVA